MSERGVLRGSSRGGRGASAARGGGSQQEKAKKESILDLKRYEDKRIIVKFNGGREGKIPIPQKGRIPHVVLGQTGLPRVKITDKRIVEGTLKGFDQLLNLVLDDCEEQLIDSAGATAARPLGLLVARGTLLTSIAPKDGSEEIANPFAEPEQN